MTTVGVVVVAVGCLVVLALLALDLSGIWRRTAHLRWQLTGLLLIGSAVLARGAALLAGWPGRRLDTLQTFLVMLAGYALFFVGLIVQIRKRRRAGRAE
jgi:hypothetical protein